MNVAVSKQWTLYVHIWVNICMCIYIKLPLTELWHKSLISAHFWKERKYKSSTNYTARVTQVPESQIISLNLLRNMQQLPLRPGTLTGPSLPHRYFRIRLSVSCRATVLVTGLQYRLITSPSTGTDNLMQVRGHTEFQSQQTHLRADTSFLPFL